MRVRLAVMPLSILVLSARLALAQPAPSPAERLKTLADRVDQLMKSAADLPAAMKALQAVQDQLAGMRQEVARLQGAALGYQALRNKLDGYDTRIGDMELKLNAVALQLAGRTQTAGFDDGFFIASPNRRLMLRLGALLQPAYQGRLPILVGKEGSASSRYPEQPVAQGESGFLIRRAQVRLGGHLLSPRFGYRLDLGFGQEDQGTVQLAYGEVRLFQALNVVVGKSIVPFGRQSMIHNAAQQFTDRSAVTDAFTPGRDLGVLVYGSAFSRDQLSYQLGVFNGAGQFPSRNDNTDLLYAGRIVYAPLGAISEDEGEGDLQLSPFRVAIGAAFYYNLSPTDAPLRAGVTDPARAAELRDQDRNGATDNVGVYAAAAELTARFRGLAWQSELFYRVENPGAVAPTNRTFWGVYTQLGGYHPASMLELAARYGFLKHPGYGEDRRLARPDEVHELAAVLNVLTWGRRLMWQGEYTHQWLRGMHTVKDGVTVAGDPLNAHQVRIQMHLAF
ncbi:MAG: hypothetical protein IT371_17345 [Deltaproteobacteria bacterium]|nr:hypothetical protein [Deltaproteobacteria bacterium]